MNIDTYIYVRMRVHIYTYVCVSVYVCIHDSFYDCLYVCMHIFPPPLYNPLLPLPLAAMTTLCSGVCSCVFKYT